MKLPAKISFQIFLQILIRRGFWLILLLFLSSLLDRWFGNQLRQELGSTQGATWQVWIWVLGTLALGITTPVLFILLLFSSFQETAHGFRDYLRQMFIENMRATGKTLWASFLFILPGIYLFAQYLFVPLIVCFDPGYQKGEKDALASARKISRPAVTALVLLSYFFLIVLTSLMMEPLKAPEFLWATLPKEVFVTTAETISHILFTFILIGLYRRATSISESRGIA